MARLLFRERFERPVGFILSDVAPRVAAVLLLFFVANSCFDGDVNADRSYAQIVRLRRSDPKVARVQAADAYKRFQQADAETAFRFRLLLAELLLDAGQFTQAEALLRDDPPTGKHHNQLAVRLAVSRLRLQSKKGDWTQAERLRGEADELLRISPDSCLSVQLLAIDSRHLITGGQFAESENYLRRMAELTGSCPDKYWEATRIYLAGTRLFAESHFEEAIETYGRALKLSRREDLKTLAPLILGDLASCHLYLGDADTALQELDDAEKLYAQTGQDFDQSIDRGRRGMIYALLRQYDKASAEYKKALLGAKTATHRGYEAQWLNTLTSLECDAGDIKAAETTDSEALRVAAPMKSMPDWAEQYATAQLNAARIARLQKDVAKAYRLIRPLASYGDSQNFRWQYQAEFAQVLAAMNQNKEAGRWFQRAIGAAEAARGEVKDVWYRMTFSAQILDLYRRYVDFLIDQKNFDKALQVADSSHARQLLEKLHSNEKLEQTTNFEKISGAQGAVILSYWLGKERSYMWLTTATGSRIFPLGDTSHLVSEIQSSRKQIEDRSDLLKNPGSSIALYKKLIAPAAALIPMGADVIIIPDGPLADLNFDTLIAPEDPKHYWVEKVCIRVAPSLSLLHSKENSQVDLSSLLLVGGTKPPQPFESLPGSQHEIETIDELFHSARRVVLSAEAATPEGFLDSDPKQFSLIHLSAHAVAVKESPLDSSIVLTPDKRNGSFRLYARQLAAMNLRADLVTLSACRGAGAKTVPGEGLVGLTWAFLRAGAHSVVAGLWNVPDRATAQLMDYFYSCLKNGETPNHALRSAKLKMLHLGAHPYYWAAFQLYSH